MIHRLCLALFAAYALAGTAFARDWSEVARPIRAGEAVQIRPDRAYLLVRIGLRGSTQDPVFLREPEAAEIAAYDSAKAAAFAKNGSKGDLQSFIFDYDGMPNLFMLSHKKRIVADRNGATILAEVRPGSYVLYGQGFGGFIYQCHCLGTVGFGAAPGVITDVGTYLSDQASKPSVYPELAAATNIGPTARMDYVLFAGALVPARATDAVPAGIDRTLVRPAKLHAVGPFVDPNVMQINRLAPVAGVLRYDGGRVIDETSGREMLPR